MSYRIRNWSAYNTALQQSRSVTFWLDESAIEGWLAPQQSGKCGASNTYSDIAIATFETIKAIYGLAGRQTEGFIASLLGLMGLALAVPEHSTVSRCYRYVTGDFQARGNSSSRRWHWHQSLW